MYALTLKLGNVMEKETRDKLVKSYEGRLKATEGRHKAEIEGIKLRHDREIKALKQQYKALLESSSRQSNSEKMN